MISHQIGGSFFVLFAVLGLLLLAFEIWMLVSVIRNRGISDNARIIWIAGMLLIHPIVAIIYYFTDRKKSL